MPTQKTSTGKTEFPFLDFDMTKIMAPFGPTPFGPAPFDPAKAAGEFFKMAGRYQVPGFDVDTLVEVQGRNLEALNAANQAAAEGARAFAKRQAEIVQQNLDAAKGAFDQLGKADTPQETAGKQAELAQDAIARVVKNTRELTDLATESNAKAAQTITGRIAEGLDEIKDLADKLQK